MANDQKNITTQEEFNKWLKNAPAVYQINENEHTKEEWLQEYKEAKISKPEQTFIITNSKSPELASNAVEMYDKSIQLLNSHYIAPNSEEKEQIAVELINEEKIKKIQEQIKEEYEMYDLVYYDSALLGAFEKELKSFNEIKENGLEKQRQKDIQAANEEYQTMLNENPYTQEVKSTESKEEISIKIKEMDFSKNPEFAEILKANEEFKGEDLKAFLQTVATMDEAIKAKNDKDLKFSGDSIKLEFKDIDGQKIDINAKLGEGYFSKDLDHLVNLGSNDISKNPPSQEAKDVFAKAVEREPAGELEKGKEKDLEKANTTEIENVGTKKEPLRFKNPANSNDLDNVLNGGVQAVSTMAESVGDEALSGFAKNVCEMYRSVGGIVSNNSTKNLPSIDEQMRQIQNDTVKKVKQAVKDGKVKIASEQKEKERSNNKDRSASR